MVRLRKRIPIDVPCKICEGLGFEKEVYFYSEDYSGRVVEFDRCETCSSEWVFRDDFGGGRTPYYRVGGRKHYEGFNWSLPDVLQ